MIYKILPPSPPVEPIIIPTRRSACAMCLRPQSTCICRWIAPVANEIDVLILQHPAEVHQAKGSARLLHLSLARSHLEVGEIFPDEQLQGLLRGPIDRPVRTVLLYPPTPGMAPPPSLDTAGLTQPCRLRLVVLDATWRKSLKMLHCNPLLRALPRLALNQAPPSAYLIRKAHHAHQLSTLEAACHALTQLERDLQRYRPLLAGFDGFVAQQLSFRNKR
ncbi:MAG: DTW domain-containing protein [Burkholderiales bacterium RIFCSPLOWO2_02_FULL_57_36]|nr:MAG: DTW domain-containing protein [Burkholderiales bacterium RIFCSPLOWO2_02_FULL_57_36]